MKKVKKKEPEIHEKCGRKMIISSKDSHMSINSMMGRIGYKRAWLHCRNCEQGYAPFDRELNINEKHKVTKGLTEVVRDFGQRIFYR